MHAGYIFWMGFYIPGEKSNSRGTWGKEISGHCVVRHFSVKTSCFLLSLSFGKCSGNGVPGNYGPALSPQN